MKSLLVCLLILVATPIVRLAGQTAPETKSCDAKPEWITKVSKPEGWNISFVDRTRKPLRESPPVASGQDLAGVVQVEYVSREKYFAFTEVIVDPCDQSASLKTQHLLIEHVYGYSRNGKTFAYGVYGNCGVLEGGMWIAAGCDTTILLMDTTGNGKFDLLRFGIWAPKSVPDWVGK